MADAGDLRATMPRLRPGGGSWAAVAAVIVQPRLPGGVAHAVRIVISTAGVSWYVAPEESILRHDICACGRAVDQDEALDKALAAIEACEAVHALKESEACGRVH